MTYLTSDHGVNMTKKDDALIREVRSAISDEMRAAMKENVMAFQYKRPTGVLPKSYGEFRKCFEHAFSRLNIAQLIGGMARLHENHPAAVGLDRMWTIVDREMSGALGAPAPVFESGRQFWEYFAPELHEEVTKMVEATLPGARLAKGNASSIADQVLSILKAGS